MKNFFLPVAFLATIMFSSCTSESKIEDSSITTNSAFARLGNDDFKNAQTQYLAMLKSSEYKDYKNSLKSFFSNLPFIEKMPTSDAEWSNWISDNIDSTKYDKIQDFESDYNNLTSKLNVVLGKNQQLFEYLSKADSKQFAEIFNLGLNLPVVSYPQNTSSCIETCINNHDAQMTALENAYHSSQIDTVFIVGGSDPGSPAYNSGWGSAFMNQEKFEEDSVNLAIQYNQCVGGCN
jgi:hypothetical protein